MSVERLEDRLAPAAGDLDLTFGTGGKVTTDFAASFDTGNAMVLQADGKIIVVGDTNSGGSGENFAVARYLPNGTLDTSFSFDGKVATDFAGNIDEATALAIQVDGKIIVAGTNQVSGGNFDFALARYNLDGSLDATFGSNGKVTTDFAGNNDEAQSVALQADGKIVVSGYAVVGDSFDFALARYNPNGTLDAHFGVQGKVTTDFASSFDEAFAVAIQTDGRIVVAGRAERFALARYNPDGSLDSTFDGDGKVITDFGGLIDEAQSVAIQANGKIVAAGFTFGGAVDFALARYNPDGSLDSDFDADGKVTTDFAGNTDEAFAVAIQPASGRIVVAGSTFGGGSPTAFALARYNPDGSLDTSFGTGGKVTTNVGANVSGDTVGVRSLAIQADGKIVAAGSTGQDFALARYQGLAPEIAVSFGDTDLSSGSDLFYGTLLQGSIVVAPLFTIRNLGDLNLTLGPITVPAGFVLTTSVATTLAPGAETSVGVRLSTTTAGVFSGPVAIATNDSDENPFVLNVSGTVLAAAAEIQVLLGSTDIPDNTGAVNFGAASLFGTPQTRTFTVRNLGNTNLTLGPAITVPDGFTLAAGFGSTTLLPGASTTFAVRLGTSTLGTFSGQVSFATNDSNENPFNFTIKGAVASSVFPPMIRGVSLTPQVDEGGVATLRGHLVDPDTLDELFLRVEWGDGTPPEVHAVGREPFALPHRYLDDPSGTPTDEFQVHFTWFDSSGASNSATLPVAVRNVAPQVFAGLPVLLRAGESLTRAGSFTDPGLDSWFATVDYGDGSGPQWLELRPGNLFTLSHRYSQPGVYRVLVTVFDDDGGVGTASFQVTVLPDSGGRAAEARDLLDAFFALASGEGVQGEGLAPLGQARRWR